MASSPRHYDATAPDGSVVRIAISYARPFAATLTVRPCVVCQRVNAIIDGDS